MNELFRKDFDSDEEDEEYIPDKKELEELKEVEPVKILVNKSKIDDIWNKMKNKNKIIQDDTNNIKNEDNKIILDSENNNNIPNVTNKPLSSIDEEIQKALTKSKEMKSKLTTETILFAGQKYQYKKEITEEDIKKQKEKDKKKTHSGLDSIVEQLDKKTNVNTYTKTKKDWNTYVEEKKIEKELDFNRKDGFLKKKQFIEETNVKLIENKKLIKRQKKD